MICFGDVPASSVLPILFGSYNSAGASVALSGLAVTDIEVYKGTSMTQRASDAGYALLDTDGIDIDSTTGINGFSIDLGDNTDAGFYAVGSFYTVVVSAVTIDSQTVNFVAATFRIREAETTAGRIEARVGSIANDAITASAIAADAIGSSELAASAVTEIQSGLATQASVDTIDDFLDTEVAAILAAVDTEVAAIKAKTDLIPGTQDGLTFAQQQVLVAAAILGKASGLATTTAVYRAADDSKDRITATVDADGNRTAVTLDAS